MYSELTGVVYDLGSSALRAGYSGEDTPKFVFPSLAGIIEESSNEMELEEVLKSSNQIKKKKFLVGDKDLRVRRDKMDLTNILWNGQVKDWDAYETLLKDTYFSQMQIVPENFPLLMSEACNTELSQKSDSNQRQKICDIVFETMKIPNFFMCKSAVLSCFASGRSTSLILDSGASSTCAVPVHDGYALRKSTLKYEIGGETITEKILKYVEEKQKINIYPRYEVSMQVDKENKKGPASYISFPNTTQSFNRFSKLEIARDIKENICKILVEKTEEINEKGEYELPDGNNLIFNQERFDFAECLFSSVGKKEFRDIEGYSFKGIHNLALDSINKCDIDIRKDLLSNIIVCGGNTLIPGLVDKLQRKISETAPQNSRLKLIAYPGSIERKFSSWIGGSILSSLGSFQNLWINKSEYEETGNYIIEKKCP